MATVLSDAISELRHVLQVRVRQERGRAGDAEPEAVAESGQRLHREPAADVVELLRAALDPPRRTGCTAIPEPPC